MTLVTPIVILILVIIVLFLVIDQGRKDYHKQIKKGIDPISNSPMVMISKQSNFNRESTEELGLKADLIEAIEDSKLELFYQPFVNQTGEIVAMEALLRWNHPTYGYISPEKVIGIAEKDELINTLGEWVLRTACLQGVQWHVEGKPTLRMTVNISGKQFRDPQLVSSIEGVLAETGFDASYLELEITESVSMFEIENSIDTLHKLKALGVSIAVDDFGTGYSSLKYIERFPIDRIKIDKSFIQKITPDTEGNDAIAKTVISLAKDLELEVVAEGVESKFQYQKLLDHDCHIYQGYYFSKPLNPIECNKLLKKEASILASVT